MLGGLAGDPADSGFVAAAAHGMVISGVGLAVAALLAWRLVAPGATAGVQAAAPA